MNNSYRIELVNHGTCWGATIRVVTPQPELDYDVAIPSGPSWENVLIRAAARIEEIRRLEVPAL